jgi:RimJ/RimL family protein N-acetyltransferase
MSPAESLSERLDFHQPFDLQPYLVGDLVELRPLQPNDWDTLFAVASDPLMWEQHPANDRYQENVFREFFQEALGSGGAFVVIDRKTRETIGSTRYFRFDPVKHEVEIGWTFLARSHWGGQYNREMKRLMLDHAFKFVKSVLFIIGSTNFRSQRAVEKIGAVRVGQRTTTNPEEEVVEQLVYQIKRPTIAPT